MADKKDKGDKGDRVRLLAQPEGALKSVPMRDERPDTAIGNYTQKLSEYLKLPPQQQLHMYVQKAGSYFIPAPDQTVGDLFKVFATDHVEYGPVLQLSYSTQVFQG